MHYKQTTQVPNELFDRHLPHLTHSELKLLLFIIRKTYGWQLRDGKRKHRDRITHSQFIKGTGTSRRSLPSTIQLLILKQLIRVTDSRGRLLHTPESRKGKVGIFYAPLFRSLAMDGTNLCKRKQEPVQNGIHNKTNRTKLTGQKGFRKQSDWERMQEIMRKREA